MKKEELALRLKNACAAVAAAEQELTEIDSRFGDADHGLTMAKIAGAISAAVDREEGGVRAMLDGAAMAVIPKQSRRIRNSIPVIPGMYLLFFI